MQIKHSKSHLGETSQVGTRESDHRRARQVELSQGGGAVGAEGVEDAAVRGKRVGIVQACGGAARQVKCLEMLAAGRGEEAGDLIGALAERRGRHPEREQRLCGSSHTLERCERAVSVGGRSSESEVSRAYPASPSCAAHQPSQSRSCCEPQAERVSVRERESHHGFPERAYETSGAERLDVEVRSAAASAQVEHSAQKVLAQQHRLGRSRHLLLLSSLSRWLPSLATPARSIHSLLCFSDFILYLSPFSSSATPFFSPFSLLSSPTPLFFSPTCFPLSSRPPLAFSLV
eukprot:scaffold57196_cov27-Tisochrysis_lutea.AAC.1